MQLLCPKMSNSKATAETATVKPSVEAVARLLGHMGYGHLGDFQSHHYPEFGETHEHSVECANWEPWADDARAVLALFPGRTEVEVLSERDEAYREALRVQTERAKAEAWDEGFKAAQEAYGLNHAAPLDPRISNPYRIEQD